MQSSCLRRNVLNEAPPPLERVGVELRPQVTPTCRPAATSSSPEVGNGIGDLAAVPGVLDRVGSRGRTQNPLERIGGVSILDGWSELCFAHLKVNLVSSGRHGDEGHDDAAGLLAQKDKTEINENRQRNRLLIPSNSRCADQHERQQTLCRTRASVGGL